MQLEQAIPLCAFILLGTMCSRGRSGTNHNQSIIGYTKGFILCHHSCMSMQQGEFGHCFTAPGTLTHTKLSNNNRKSFAFSAWQIPLPIFQLTFQSSLCNTYNQESFIWQLRFKAGKKNVRTKISTGERTVTGFSSIKNGDGSVPGNETDGVFYSISI